MRKNHLRLLMAAGSMLAAGAIALSGTLAATAAPSSSSASGIEHFQFMSTSTTATHDTIARAELHGCPRSHCAGDPGRRRGPQ